ncbi:MAG: baseplate J/gp47 family protein [Lentisphaerota bacterium]
MALDLNNLNTEEQQFADALEQSGMSITDTAIKADLQALADAAHLPIANSNRYSPFWNFCIQAVILPVQFLVAFLIRRVMPGLYVKTASGAMLDLIAWGYDLTRKPAVKTRGDLVFSRGNTSGQLQVPAGTRVRTIAINGNVYRMITLFDATIEAGSSSVRVAAEAESAGSAYNLGATYYSIMDSSVPGVVAVTNPIDYLSLPGADEESDEELRLRIRNQFSAVGDWHTDAKYKAMIAAQTGFRIDRIFFDHNIPRGPGSADAYILFDAGTVPTAYLAAVNAYISDQGNHGHGDDLLVKAMPETTHDVAVDVIFKASVAPAAKAGILANIEQFIRCAFRENSDYLPEVTQTWPYARFSFSRLDYELHDNFPGIAALEWAQGDIVSTLDVPRLDTLTVAETD